MSVFDDFDDVVDLDDPMDLDEFEEKYKNDFILLFKGENLNVQQIIENINGKVDIERKLGNEYEAVLYSAFNSIKDNSRISNLIIYYIGHGAATTGPLPTLNPTGTSFKISLINFVRKVYEIKHVFEKTTNRNLKLRFIIDCCNFEVKHREKEEKVGKLGCVNRSLFEIDADLLILSSTKGVKSYYEKSSGETLFMKTLFEVLSRYSVELDETILQMNRELKIRYLSYSKIKNEVPSSVKELSDYFKIKSSFEENKLFFYECSTGKKMKCELFDQVFKDKFMRTFEEKVRTKNIVYDILRLKNEEDPEIDD